MCGGQKEGEEWYGEEALNESYFCKIAIIKQDSNFISQTFGQTSNPNHYNQHAQKTICRNFQVILCSSSWSRTTLCIFKEQI